MAYAKLASIAFIIFSEKRPLNFKIVFFYKDQSVSLNFELSYNERTLTVPIFEKQKLIGYEIRNVSNFD